MSKTIKVLFYDTKPYDKQFFDRANEAYGFQIKYFKEHLNHDTACYTNGHDVVCAFVNDVIDKDVIDIILRNKVQLVALRCAGYNNVDLKSAYGKIHVVRVPGYSPHAVAEHSRGVNVKLKPQDS